MPYPCILPSEVTHLWKRKVLLEAGVCLSLEAESIGQCCSACSSPGRVIPVQAVICDGEKPFSSQGPVSARWWKINSWEQWLPTASQLRLESRTSHSASIQCHPWFVGVILSQVWSLQPWEVLTPWCSGVWVIEYWSSLSASFSIWWIIQAISKLNHSYPAMMFFILLFRL